MVIPRSLNEFKSFIDTNLRDNVQSESLRPQLKVQMIESNLQVMPTIDGFSEWTKMEDSGYWYVCNDSRGDYIVLNKLSERIWSAYSLMKMNKFDKITSNWIRGNIGLDKCWLSTDYIKGVAAEYSWDDRGMGIKYKDSLFFGDIPSQVSIKAWYGLNDDVKKMLEQFADRFSINSLRFKDHNCSMTSEWYSSGKITFNASDDADAPLNAIDFITNMYERELRDVEKIVREDKCSFEFRFKQQLNLESYSEVVSSGKGELKLWMTETEKYDDFRRFRGVDLHTWDRVFLDMGQDYAYMTIPGKGCVNAAPRLVAIHGESSTGNTKVYLQGAEIFV